VIVPPPGSCGAAMERIANPGKDAYMLDWFMTFKKMAKSMLTLPPTAEKK